jgi:hypothetical protein
VPTNPIGKNTVNLSLNMLRAERKLLGRLAGSRKISTGCYTKRLILRGLLAESPADAALLIRITEGRGR